VAAIEDELARGRALTSPEWTGLHLEDAPLRPTPHEIGAVAGFGLASEEPPLRANVYVFDTWSGGDGVGERLRQLVDGGPYRALSAVNGALLLFAVAETDDPAVERVLRRFVGKFHGME
jgi:hypothetical protein